MPASTNLCGLSDAKAYLGIDDSSEDAFLGDLIDRASEAIESFCRAEFGQVERTEYHDGGSGIVVLGHRPVLQVGSVHDDPNREFPGGSLVASSSYVVKKLAGYILLADGDFAPGLNSVRVVYTSGYVSVPDDVAQACVMLVAAWYNRAHQGADGLAEEKLADYAARYATEPFPEAAKGLLEPYVEVAA